VELSAREAAELAARTDVLSLTPDEPNPLTRIDPAALTGGVPMTDQSPQVLGLRGPFGAWAQVGGQEAAGAGQVIGIIDTGIDWTNPSFAADGMADAGNTFGGTCDKGQDARRWPAQACNSKIVGARFFAQGPGAAGEQIGADDSMSPRDTDGHGSHVAGIAAGRDHIYSDGGNSIRVSGMAPMAQLAAYKACWDIPRYGQVLCYPQDSIAALDAAVSDGVDVVNFSIGAVSPSLDDAVGLAFRNAAASGVFIAAAGGNGGPSAGSVEHVVPWVTTVGAATHKGASGSVPSIARFSGRGPSNLPTAQQTVLKPDIGAPGVSVLSAVTSTPGAPPQWSYKSGTSMASPHVAGLAALVRQKHPSWSPMAIKSALMTSSRVYADAESNRPFVGGAGFINPSRMFDPGLVFDSTESQWAQFRRSPASGYTLNAPSLQVPALPSTGPVEVTRTLRNVSGSSATYNAAYDGPSTLTVSISPRTITVPAGQTATVTLSVANSGAPTSKWQQGRVTWSSSTQADTGIPVAARGAVTTTPATTTRWEGANRYETAAVIASKFDKPVDTVYLSSGTTFADALAATPLAANGIHPAGIESAGNPAPILLSGTRLPRATIEALDDLKPRNVVLLGGTKSLPSSLQRDLTERGYAVTRVGGGTRYDTASKLSLAYGRNVPVVYVASGADRSFPDALSGAALAATEGGPILLTGRDSVPASVTSALKQLNPTKIVVLGGQESVSDTVYTTLGATERISGTGRFETSAAVAKKFPASLPRVFVASGRNWPDALAGAVIAGSQRSPVLITERDIVPEPVLQRLVALRPREVVVIGGSSAVASTVEDQVVATLR
ncbi:MAG: cell wall-binding repeat-containing protein, partial [Ornithinimicrobium sp.]